MGIVCLSPERALGVRQQRESCDVERSGAMMPWMRRRPGRGRRRDHLACSRGERGSYGSTGVFAVATISLRTGIEIAKRRTFGGGDFARAEAGSGGTPIAVQLVNGPRGAIDRRPTGRAVCPFNAT
jgi:hypothetical protein